MKGRGILNGEKIIVQKEYPELQLEAVDIQNAHGVLLG